MAAHTTTTTPTVSVPTVSVPTIQLPSAGSFVHAFTPLWPLLVLLGVVGLARLVWFALEARRLRRSGIHQIDLMDGTTFERRLAVLFRALGYSAEITGRTYGDYGCDLIVKRDGNRYAVQAKRYGKNVGIKAVQEAAASRLHYGADAAMVVTNRYFTKQARTLARSNKVELWDRDRLVKALLTTSRQKALATEPAPMLVQTLPTGVDASPSVPAHKPEPLCARCGDKVSARVLDYCTARPERFGGLVYCFKHQRGVQPGS